MSFYHGHTDQIPLNERKIPIGTASGVVVDHSDAETSCQLSQSKAAAGISERDGTPDGTGAVAALDPNPPSAVSTSTEQPFFVSMGAAMRDEMLRDVGVDEFNDFYSLTGFVDIGWGAP